MTNRYRDDIRSGASRVVFGDGDLIGACVAIANAYRDRESRQILIDVLEESKRLKDNPSLALV